MTTHRIVSESIRAPADAVYAFASQVQRLPEWASGLASDVREEEGLCVADSPMGRIRIAMAPKNDFGVLDHDVTLPDGTTVHNAFRVTPDGAHSVVAFVVLRQPGMDDAALERDAAHVTKDLQTLKRLVEAHG